MLLLDNVVLEINPNKHAAIIKTITLNTFKTDTRSPQPYHISIIMTHVVITRKICRFNEKRCRYYEKICRFNEKRSRYYEKICRFNEKRSRYNEKRSRYKDIIEWKKYYMDGSITSPYYCVNNM